MKFYWLGRYDTLTGNFPYVNIDQFFLDLLIFYT